MQHVFADAFYWIALANPADEWHVLVSRFNSENPDTTIITTEEVLIEFVNYFSEFRERRRVAVVEMCRSVLSHARIDVVPQSHRSFETGLELFTQRGDKGYSLTDCISMLVMKERGIEYVLTHDQHFVQEGFTNIF